MLAELGFASLGDHIDVPAQLESIALQGFGDLQPLFPAEDAPGDVELVNQPGRWLAEVAHYRRVSSQPNAGSQGEFAGLLEVSGDHRSRGEERDVCLIPASANDTNATSSVMVCRRVAVEASNEDGIIRQCDFVHGHGEQGYTDRASFSPLPGLAQRGRFGGDVSHLNVHKTFCAPHGRDGPGVGGAAVFAHLTPFLRTHPHHPDPVRCAGTGAASAAPKGWAGTLQIPWAYIRIMGADGLAAATKNAALRANYLAARIDSHFAVLYAGDNWLVAHERIFDLRMLTAETISSVQNVAKWLVGVDCHTRTMNFPVADTRMLEPTESEDLAKFAHFILMMATIGAGISQVAASARPVEESRLSRAPHRAAVIAEEWGQPHFRGEAASRRLRELRSVSIITPLYAMHGRLGASFTDIAEHMAVRTTAGLFALCHMGEIEVIGPHAGAAFDYALVTHPSRVVVDRARYSMICDADGGILDDLVVYRLEDQCYMVVATAGNTRLVAACLEVRAKGFDVVVRDALAVQGPSSAAIIASLASLNFRSLGYYAIKSSTLAEHDVLLARAGYLGEDSFEIYCRPAAAVCVWGALTRVSEAHGLVPAGLACRDSLRLEAGMPLYGHELSRGITPPEAGLGKVTSLDKDGDFVGRAALEAGGGTSPSTLHVGLVSHGRRAPRTGYIVVNPSTGDRVGEVTSGLPSPTLKVPIAMAFVLVGLSESGTLLQIYLRGIREDADVVSLPFYRRTV